MHGVVLNCVAVDFLTFFFFMVFSGPKFSLGTDEPKSLLEDMPSSDTDINLEISFAEQAANLKDSSVGKIYKSGGGDTLLPVGFLIYSSLFLARGTV